MLGQKSEPPATIAAELKNRIAQAVRVERSPRLDGTLDDPIWQRASPITDFKQREPYEEQPATERTEVRVLYSRNEVYFGIACHDSAPNDPVGTQLRRDVTQELDDYFEIVIDSRHDRRNAYVFQINPLGTQRDALITDERAGDTQDGDPGWDGVWISEANRTRRHNSKILFLSRQQRRRSCCASARRCAPCFEELGFNGLLQPFHDI